MNTTPNTDADSPFRAVISWHVDCNDPDAVFEHVPLYGKFQDNGVYLEYYDSVADKVKNVSSQIQRYGLVNTKKVGEYVLKYKCKVAGNEWDLDRRVIVQEPNWLLAATPSIFQMSPLFRQIIQRYSDIFYELNYLADNAYYGLNVSKVLCEKYKSSWQPPEGSILSFSDGWWEVYGYTFSKNDKVEIDGADFQKISAVVNEVETDEDKWNFNHEEYQVGDWVTFLDKIYVCRQQHKPTTYNLKSIKPTIIYPTDEKYWLRGCRVFLINYTYSNGKREIQEGAIPTTGFPLRIKRRRPFVDSQGFIYEYNYEEAEHHPIILRCEITDARINNEKSVIQYKLEYNTLYADTVDIVGIATGLPVNGEYWLDITNQDTITVKATNQIISVTADVEIITPPNITENGSNATIIQETGETATIIKEREI